MRKTKGAWLRHSARKRGLRGARVLVGSALSVVAQELPGSLPDMKPAESSAIADADCEDSFRWRYAYRGQFVPQNTAPSGLLRPNPCSCCIDAPIIRAAWAGADGQDWNSRVCRVVYLPSTRDFPPDPTLLSREELDSTYLQLRGCYSSLMRSRGQHRNLASKAREEAGILKQRLLDLARREASVRKDVYEMLEIVTALAGDIEDAGDDLVNEFGRYRLGRKTFQGGSYLGGLMQAVIRFISRWTRTKDRVAELDQKRQAFLTKTQDLPPLTLGGNGHQGPVNQSAPGESIQEVNIERSATATAEDHGPDH